jgi:protein-S-isoprenylcysteine O-methyltransferase Ste14
VPSVLGFAVALRCVWDFGWTGHGTPAPMAPPQRLVVVGYYRYVRNPMYLGMAAGWIGLWTVFGHPNPVVIAAVAADATLGEGAIACGFFEQNQGRLGPRGVE